MVFVPFLGAAVAMKSNPVSIYNDAKIALAGPYAGTWLSESNHIQ